MNSIYNKLKIMTGKEAFKKALILVEKETTMRHESRKGKTTKEKYAIDAVVSTLVNVKIMLQNLDKEIIE
jgi:hypothetical protein